MNRRRFLKNSLLWVPAAPYVARAQVWNDPSVVGSWTRRRSSGCATTDTSIPHDELLEGFQTPTTGYENTWSQVGTTANITAAGNSTSLTSGKPTGACNQAWKLVVPTDGTETYAQWDRGSLINVNTQAVDFAFYLYVETAPDNGEGYYIFAVSSGTDPSSSPCVRVNLSTAGGVTSLFAFGSDGTALVTVATGTWHKVAVHVDTTTTGAASTLTVDGGSAQTFNRNSTGIQYVSFGTTSSLDVNDSGTLWFDVICVNTP